MADEKGALNKEQEKAIAEMIDQAIKAKGFVELIDGYLARIAIVILDDVAIDKIKKEEIKTQLGVVSDKAIAKDLAGVQAETTTLINMLVDIPGLDENYEQLIINGIVTLLAGLIQKWVAKEQIE